MTKRHNNAGAGVTRRNLLKAAGALAGAGAASSFPAPAVWSQEEKVLRYLGTAVNQSDDIIKKVKDDTGITLQNIVATTDDVTKRVITQPNSFDILDTEYFSLKKLVPWSPITLPFGSAPLVKTGVMLSNSLIFLASIGKMLPDGTSFLRLKYSVSRMSNEFG